MFILPLSRPTDLPQVSRVERCEVTNATPPGIPAGVPHQPRVQFNAIRLKTTFGTFHHLKIEHNYICNVHILRCRGIITQHR